MYRVLIFHTVLVLISGSVIIQKQQPSKSRIIGGIETNITKFPYIVSLQYYETHRCGGIILTFNVILLAANCVHGLNPSNMEVIAGRDRRNEKGIERLVKNVVIHEKYDAWENNYDIAIVILTKPFPFSNTIQSIPLANTGDELKPGTRVYIAGWGARTEGGYTELILHDASLHIIDQDECANDYIRFKNITDVMICAGDRTGLNGVCYGDFGGPMVVTNRLYGIISWSAGCAEKEYPAVFVKINKFRDWIASNIET